MLQRSLEFIQRTGKSLTQASGLSSALYHIRQGINNWNTGSETVTAVSHHRDNPQPQSSSNVRFSVTSISQTISNSALAEGVKRRSLTSPIRFFSSSVDPSLARQRFELLEQFGQYLFNREPHRKPYPEVSCITNTKFLGEVIRKIERNAGYSYQEYETKRILSELIKANKILSATHMDEIIDLLNRIQYMRVPITWEILDLFDVISHIQNTYDLFNLVSVLDKNRLDTNAFIQALDDAKISSIFSTRESIVTLTGSPYLCKLLLEKLTLKQFNTLEQAYLLRKDLELYSHGKERRPYLADIITISINRVYENPEVTIETMEELEKYKYLLNYLNYQHVAVAQKHWDKVNFGKLLTNHPFVTIANVIAYCGVHKQLCALLPENKLPDNFEKLKQLISPLRDKHLRLEIVTRIIAGACISIADTIRNGAELGEWLLLSEIRPALLAVSDTTLWRILINAEEIVKCCDVVEGGTSEISEFKRNLFKRLGFHNMNKIVTQSNSTQLQMLDRCFSSVDVWGHFCIANEITIPQSTISCRM